MDQNDYKYEVAFSFLDKDEALAIAIKDLMQDRLLAFIYSERQAELAGTDGEETFNKVFGKEARIVVVLYRDGWGKTPWTRIEETAIRNRAHNEGYDFTIFIKVEQGATMPQWLPKTRIWSDLERFGVNGAAIVILARVQEAGGSTREESVAEYAARQSRQLAAKESRMEFLASEEGVDAASNELGALLTAVETLVRECEPFAFHTQSRKEGLDVYDPGYGGIVVEWHSQIVNNLKCSGLRVQLWDGTPSRPDRIFYVESNMLSEERYSFDRDLTGQLGWRRKSGDKRFLTSQQLAETCLKKLMDFAHKQRMGDPHRDF